MDTPYVIHASGMDLYAACMAESRQAYKEGMYGLGDRQRAMADHLKNASEWAMANCPKGYRVDVTVQFAFVPDVNPTYNFSRGNIYKYETEEA